MHVSREMHEYSLPALPLDYRSKSNFFCLSLSLCLNLTCSLSECLLVASSIDMHLPDRRYKSSSSSAITFKPLIIHVKTYRVNPLLYSPFLWSSPPASFNPGLIHGTLYHSCDARTGQESKIQSHRRFVPELYKMCPLLKRKTP